MLLPASDAARPGDLLHLEPRAHTELFVFIHVHDGLPTDRHIALSVHGSTYTWPYRPTNNLWRPTC